MRKMEVYGQVQYIIEHVTQILHYNLITINNKHLSNFFFNEFKIMTCSKVIKTKTVKQIKH